MAASNSLYSSDSRLLSHLRPGGDHLVTHTIAIMSEVVLKQRGEFVGCPVVGLGVRPCRLWPQHIIRDAGGIS